MVEQKELEIRHERCQVLERSQALCSKIGGSIRVLLFLV